MNFQNVLMSAAGHVDDRLVLKRVRSELGHVSSHPKAIDVQVSQGAVTIRGPVLNAEVMDILNGVESVRGVRAVRYELDGYNSAEGVQSLQEGSAAGDRELDDLPPRRWVPMARTAVTAGLVATGAWAMIRARA